VLQTVRRRASSRIALALCCEERLANSLPSLVKYNQWKI